MIKKKTIGDGYKTAPVYKRIQTKK
ncbi:hypothetical protein LCGC14_1070580, partial [marine sediment metagenome]